MSDLIERLEALHRNLRPVKRDPDHCSGVEVCHALEGFSAIWEARDEIERLTAENKRTAKLLKETIDVEIEQVDEINRLTAALESTECTCLSFHGGECDRCKALSATDTEDKRLDNCVNCGGAMGGPLMCCHNPKSPDTEDKK
jgi:hypothetical protein